VVWMTGGCSGTFIAAHFVCERVSYNERGPLRIVKGFSQEIENEHQPRRTSL
jgi:hypothetical protein